MGFNYRVQFIKCVENELIKILFTTKNSEFFFRFQFDYWAIFQIGRNKRRFIKIFDILAFREFLDKIER